MRSGVRILYCFKPLGVRQIASSRFKTIIFISKLSPFVSRRYNIYTWFYCVCVFLFRMSGSRSPTGMGDGCEKMVGPPSNLDSSSSESIDGDMKSHIHLLHKPSAISFGHSMIAGQVRNSAMDIIIHSNRGCPKGSGGGGVVPPPLLLNVSHR